MVSAWVPNKYYELREHRYARPARSRAPALLVIAIAIKLPGVVPAVVHLDSPPYGRGPRDYSKKDPRDGRRYPGYVEPERNADDSSREKNEPIGLNRAYLADNRDLPA